MRGLAALTGRAFARMSCTVVTRLASGTRDTRYSIFLWSAYCIAVEVGVLAASCHAEIKGNEQQHDDRKAKSTRRMVSARI